MTGTLNYIKQLKNNLQCGPIDILGSPFSSKQYTKLLPKCRLYYISSGEYLIFC